MRVVFMGTPDFAVGTLEKIIEAGHEVIAVVTQPDKPKGRGGALQMSPVKETALAHNLKVWQPVKIKNDENFIGELKNLAPDVIVVVAFGQLLPKEVLDIPKHGCINVHASLLPAYRGAAPIQWAVIDGLEETGVTTMLMNEGLDTGDIIMQSKLPIDKKETGGSLFDKLSFEGAKLLVNTLKLLEENKAVFKKQDDSKSNYAKMLNKSLGKIDFEKDAVVIERLIRGLNPWPSAFTHLNGKTLKIWDADVENEICGEEFTNGSICKITKDAFYVKCGNGILKVNEVQLEGKKRMSSDAFLRGCQLNVGQILD